MRDKDQDPLSYPVKRAADYAYDTTEAGISVIPIAGGALQKFIQTLGFDPFRKREQEFFEALAETVKSLRDRDVFQITDLQDNTYFEGLIAEIHDKFLHARTEEKKTWLLNAATEALSGLSVDEVAAGRFLALIEQYSQMHVLILRFLAEPSGNTVAVECVRNISMGGLGDFMVSVFRPHRLTRDMVQIVFDDLELQGLVSGSINTTISASGLMSKRTTALGDAFLKFIGEKPE